MVTSCRTYHSPPKLLNDCSVRGTWKTSDILQMVAS